MRSTLVITALVLVAAFAAGCRPYKGAPAGANSAATAATRRPSGTETRAVYQLPNGLTVVLEENHAAPVVAIEACLRVGSAEDPANREGLAHLFQHLLLRSTTARPHGRTGRDIDSIGGRLGAWTGLDQTVFHALVASSYLDRGMDLMADLFNQAAPIAPADVEAARAAARDDLRQASILPDRVAAQAALATAFAPHPYGRPLLGTPASLTAITVDDVRGFFDRFYGARNTTLVIVGDFDAASARNRLAASFFGSWRSGTPPQALPALAERGTGPRVAVVTADIATPQLVVGFRTPPATDPDLPALELLAAVLGSGRGGRLEVEIAHNRQLATAPRAYLFNAREMGLLVATASLGPGHVDDAARAILDELMRLSRERVGTDELVRASTIVEGDGASAKTTLQGYASKLGLFSSLADDPGYEASYLQRLRDVDPDALVQAAARFFRASNLVVVAVLPAARDPQRDDRAAKLTPRLRAVAAASEVSAAIPVATAAVAAPVPGTESGHDAVDYLLPSGVRVLVLRDDTAAQVSVRAVWPGGVRFEDARLAGATALLARLLPRATKTRGAEQLASELAEVGGVLDGSSGIDSLSMRGDFLSSHWERGMDLLVDCLRNPKLGEDDVERERRVLLDAVRARDDDPTEVALGLFQSSLFARHPYRLGAIGTSDSVAGLTRRRLLDHFRRFYRPRNLTVAVLGNVDPPRVAAKIQSLFADLIAASSDRDRDRDSVVPGAVEPLRSEPLEVVRTISKAEARVILGYPGVTLRDPDRFALDVLAEILGGATGRLSALAQAAGPITGARAASQEGVDPGYFAVTAAVRPDSVDAAIPSLRATMARLTESGVSDDEVIRAREVLVGTRAVALDRRGAIALAVALHGAFGDAGGQSYRRDVELLAVVTAADVLRVARRIVDPRREVLAVVRPRGPERPAASNGPAGPARYTSR